jgi:hypothetical protein
LCVGFVITPFFNKLLDNDSAKLSSLNSIAKNNPTPLTYFIYLPFRPSLSNIRLKFYKKILPIFSEFYTNFSSNITFKAANAVLAANGFPPNVDPCSPGFI